MSIRSEVSETDGEEKILKPSNQWRASPSTAHNKAVHPKGGLGG